MNRNHNTANARPDATRAVRVDSARSGPLSRGAGRGGKSDL